MRKKLKAAKARPKKKAPRQTEPSNGKSVTRGTLHPTVAEVERELAQARKTLEGIDLWDQERRNKAKGKVTELEQKLPAAQLREMPLPPPSVARLKFQERIVPVSAIRITGNHRELDEEAATARLARSLVVLGLQQRVGLRDAGDGSFELIWGSRRLAATQLNAEGEIPAKVYPTSLTGAEVEILRTIENFGRKELTAIERAIAVARTLDAIETMLTAHQQGGLSGDGGDGAAWQSGADLKQAIDSAGGLHSYVGQQLGFPERWVRDHAYVSHLGGEARRLLAAHRIDIGHARELAKLGDKKVADNIAGWAARDERGLGGRDAAWVHAQVLEHLRSLNVVPWRLDVAFGKDAPGCTGYACTTCPFNSRSDPDLFGGSIADEPAAGVCTNEACFRAKQDIAEKAIAKVVEKAAKKLKKIVMPVTENFVAEFVPIHIKPASAARKAKKELEASATSSVADETEASSHATRIPTAQEKATRKFNEAVNVWATAARDAIQQAAFSVPGRLLACLAMDWKIEAWQADAAIIADHLNDLETTVRPTLEGLLRLEKSLKDGDVSVQILEGPSDDLLAELVKLWGVELPPRPSESDFLQKSKAKSEVRGAK